MRTHYHIPKIGLTGLLIAGILTGLGWSATTLSDVRFEEKTLPSAKAYIVRIPKNSGFILFPSISTSLDATEKQVGQLYSSIYVTPVAAINAGFFDPKSGTTISYVVKNGETILNPSENPMLMNNSGLKPYLSKVLNRSEFRVLDCMNGLRYEIQNHDSPMPSGCVIRNSIQAGPELFSNGSLDNEAFTAHDSNGKLLRDAIGYRYKNARSAIGIDALGQPILVMISQITNAKIGAENVKGEPLNNTLVATNLDDDSKPQSRGMSIPELSQYMKSLGAVQAMALDGGSSSSMWVSKRNFFGKLNGNGRPIQRRVKSVWIVGRKKY